MEGSRLALIILRVWLILCACVSLAHLPPLPSTRTRIVPSLTNTPSTGRPRHLRRSRQLHHQPQHSRILQSRRKLVKLQPARPRGGSRVHRIRGRVGPHSRAARSDLRLHHRHPMGRCRGD